MTQVECGRLILAFLHAKLQLTVCLDLMMIRDSNVIGVLETKDYTV